MSGNRIEKVNSLLEHEIAKIIQREIAFPDGVLVTLTRVQANANLFEAKVYISALPEDKIEASIKILNNNVYDIQQKINRALKMRPIPRIKFVKDEIIGKAGKIEEILSKIKEEDKD